MGTSIEEWIVRTMAQEWTPLVEAGVNTAGLWIKPLRVDRASGRAPTFLLRFEAGASYPYHGHPAGEELFVLEGSCVIEGATLRQGDYLFTPPGARHSVRSDEGCTLHFNVPVEVEIV
jgi:quercetin dioxygenase-like cupin family protein